MPLLQDSLDDEANDISYYMTQLTSFMDGATPPPHNAINDFSHTDSPSSGQNVLAIPPGSSTSLTRLDPFFARDDLYVLPVVSR